MHAHIDERKQTQQPQLSHLAQDLSMKEEENAAREREINIQRWSQKTIPPHHSKSRKWYVLLSWQTGSGALQGCQNSQGITKKGDNKERNTHPYHHIKYSNIYYHIIMHGIWDYVYIPLVCLHLELSGSFFRFKNGKQGFAVELG